MPPQTREVAVRTALMFLTFVLFGLAIPLMFLLFDLVYLSIISAVVWVFTVIADLIFVYMPLRGYCSKHAG